MRTLIPKQKQDYPDYYGIEITFITGIKKKLIIAGHWIRDNTMIHCINGEFQNSDGNRYRLEPSNSPFFEYVTKDDEWGIVPMSSIQDISFDKDWSKILAVRNKK